jgi:hypothetical protein
MKAYKLELGRFGLQRLEASLSEGEAPAPLPEDGGDANLTPLAEMTPSEADYRIEDVGDGLDVSQSTASVFFWV